MSNPIWEAEKERRYLEESGEGQRRREADERNQREADRESRRTMGDDCPNPYRSR